MHIATAFLRPAGPVQALALPELITTAYTLGLLRCFLQMVIGAATILFVVKTAAAVAPFGHAKSARSNFPDFLIPQCTPAAQKPFAAVIVLFAIISSLTKQNYAWDSNTISGNSLLMKEKSTLHFHASFGMILL